MKVLLVNPPQEPDIDSNLPKFVDQARGALPPLGLMYVGASVKAAGHEVKIADYAIGDDVVSAIVAFKPDIIGITTTTFTLLSALSIVDKASKISDARIAVGGVHPSIYPSETLLSHPGIDYSVSGEGEACFPELLQKIQSGTMPSGVVRSEGFIENLDNLPVIDRTMTDWRKYKSALDGTGYIATVMTSRGCPFNCVFCHRPHMGRKFRARSPQSVLAEIESIKKLGINEATFYDDTFAVNRERVVKICEGMIREKFNLKWDMRTRVDLVDKELLKLLKRAGCKQIRYGVEASSNRILKEIGKGITVEQAAKAIGWTKETGIESLAYFIIGSPGETPEDWEKTIQFSKKLNPDYCYFAIMTPYPSTNLYERWLAETKLPDHWADFACHPREIETPYYQNWVERAILERTLKRAYQQFYLRPSYLVKKALAVRSWAGIKRGLSAVAGMVKK